MSTALVWQDSQRYAITLALCCTNACMKHNNHIHLHRCLISGYLQRIPEVTAHWFTQIAVTALTDNSDTTDVPDFSEVPCSNNSRTNNILSKEMFCVCNGPGDGRRMIFSVK